MTSNCHGEAELTMDFWDIIAEIPLRTLGQTPASKIYVERPTSPTQYFEDSADFLFAIKSEEDDDASKNSDFDDDASKNSNDDQSASSPLDLMQMIADLTASGKSGKKCSGAEIVRRSLVPIRFEQLKRCANLNAEEVVVVVNSTLADYSINQRLFGEAVFGL